jgi:hypothetical protein
MKRLFSLIASGIAVFGITSAAWAQGQQQPPPNAPTTVQLPTFSFFTVQTTVSVPDRGGAYLGGIGRGADSSTTRGIGPLANRGLASSRGASGMSVHATIIDHHEIDQAILAQAAAERGAAANPAVAKAAAISRTVGKSDSLDSVAAIREQQSAAAAKQASEATEYFAKAQKAEADGKPGVATIFYQMVIRRDATQLKQQAQARLAALQNSKAASVAAR